ncbi:MAG: 2Fe-2S iron-sulfur cluster-binding protein [Solirubrobacterales bacterium]
MTPAPDAKPITLVVDGVEIEANEGAMLVDAAKHGDVEIPVFCYEPKLGEPVGACRMCLVEIEGIPKLQTACSTPVRDGMVVYTQNARVKEAQNAVVEFLLVNHPLDCPVLRQGRRVPAAGHLDGLGSRAQPRHRPQAPLREAAAALAADQDRPPSAASLCYRCVRFSQGG